MAIKQVVSSCLVLSYLFSVIFPIEAFAISVREIVQSEDRTLNVEKVLAFPTKLYVVNSKDTIKKLCKKYNISKAGFNKLNQNGFSVSYKNKLIVGSTVNVPMYPLTNLMSRRFDGKVDSGLVVASKAGNILNRDIKNSIITAADSELNAKINSFLSQYGTAQVKFTASEKFNFANSQFSVLMPIYDKSNKLFYTQLSYHRTNDKRSIGNFGLGARYFIQHHMFGTNVFYDHDFTYHLNRLGVGAEYARNYIKASFNGYLGSSSWHNTLLNALYVERPAKGWDLRLQAYLPQQPELGAKIMFEQYYGHNVGLFGFSKLQNNPYALNLGVSYTPVPLCDINIDYKIGKNSKRLLSLGCSVNYRLGLPLSEQLNPENIGLMRTLQGSRYDLVDRNNNMVLEYKQNGFLSIDAPNQVVLAAANDNNFLKAKLDDNKYNVAYNNDGSVSFDVYVNSTSDIFELKKTVELNSSFQEALGVVSLTNTLIRAHHAKFKAIISPPSKSSGNNNHYAILITVVDKAGRTASTNVDIIAKDKNSIDKKQSFLQLDINQLPANNFTLMEAKFIIKNASAQAITNLSKKDVTFKVKNKNDKNSSLVLQNGDITIKDGTAIAKFKALKGSVGRYSLIATYKNSLSKRADFTVVDEDFFKDVNFSVSPPIIKTNEKAIAILKFQNEKDNLKNRVNEIKLTSDPSYEAIKLGNFKYNTTTKDYRAEISSSRPDDYNISVSIPNTKSVSLKVLPSDDLRIIKGSITITPNILSSAEFKKSGAKAQINLNFNSNDEINPNQLKLIPIGENASNIKISNIQIIDTSEKAAIFNAHLTSANINNILPGTYNFKLTYYGQDLAVSLETLTIRPTSEDLILTKNSYFKVNDETLTTAEFKAGTQLIAFLHFQSDININVKKLKFTVITDNKANIKIDAIVSKSRAKPNIYIANLHPIEEANIKPDIYKFKVSYNGIDLNIPPATLTITPDPNDLTLNKDLSYFTIKNSQMSRGEFAQGTQLQASIFFKSTAAVNVNKLKFIMISNNQDYIKLSAIKEVTNNGKVVYVANLQPADLHNIITDNYIFKIIYNNHDLDLGAVTLTITSEILDSSSYFKVKDPELYITDFVTHGSQLIASIKFQSNIEPDITKLEFIQTAGPSNIKIGTIHKTNQSGTPAYVANITAIDNNNINPNAYEFKVTYYNEDLKLNNAILNLIDPFILDDSSYFKLEKNLPTKLDFINNGNRLIAHLKFKSNLPIDINNIQFKLDLANEAITLSPITQETAPNGDIIYVSNVKMAKQNQTDIRKDIIFKFHVVYNGHEFSSLQAIFEVLPEILDSSSYFKVKDPNLTASDFAHGTQLISAIKLASNIPINQQNLKFEVTSNNQDAITLSPIHITKETNQTLYIADINPVDIQKIQPDIYTFKATYNNYDLFLRNQAKLTIVPEILNKLKSFFYVTPDKLSLSNFAKGAQLTAIIKFQNDVAVNPDLITFVPAEENPSHVTVIPITHRADVTYAANIKPADPNNIKPGIYSFKIAYNGVYLNLEPANLNVFAEILDKNKSSFQAVPEKLAISEFTNGAKIKARIKFKNDVEVNPDLIKFVLTQGNKNNIALSIIRYQSDGSYVANVTPKDSKNISADIYQFTILYNDKKLDLPPATLTIVDEILDEADSSFHAVPEKLPIAEFANGAQIKARIKFKNDVRVNPDLIKFVSTKENANNINLGTIRHQSDGSYIATITPKDSNNIFADSYQFKVYYNNKELNLAPANLNVFSEFLDKTKSSFQAIPTQLSTLDFSKSVQLKGIVKFKNTSFINHSLIKFVLTEGNAKNIILSTIRYQPDGSYVATVKPKEPNNAPIATYKFKISYNNKYLDLPSAILTIIPAVIKHKN